MVSRTKNNSGIIINYVQKISKPFFPFFQLSQTRPHFFNQSTLGSAPGLKTFLTFHIFQSIVKLFLYLKYVHSTVNIIFNIIYPSSIFEMLTKLSDDMLSSCLSVFWNKESFINDFTSDTFDSSIYHTFVFIAYVWSSQNL